MANGIVDFLTGMYAVITGDHHYIHIGKGYVINGTTSSIAAAGSEYISFKTPSEPSGRVIHFRPAEFSSRANSMKVTITEGAVMTGGTKAVPQNLNRFKPNASLVEAFTGATLSIAGIGGVVFSAEVGTGGASNRAGGSGSAEQERVLKPDTVYSIQFENTGSSNATFVTYSLFWYEE